MHEMSKGQNPPKSTRSTSSSMGIYISPSHDVLSVPNKGKGGVFAFVKITHKPVSPVSTPIYRRSDNMVHLPPAANSGSALGAIHPPRRKRTLNSATIYPYTRGGTTASPRPYRFRSTPPL
mmetsp:Transcript_20872/g.41759  ORF Transcript_20872/g.41759 Transcript_20872/m.41759 type:complete len:121 (-) Transcript_20872:275-637(-)